ncbi:MAG: hypothetical protein SPI58_01760 [Candidatus Enteromonas sp.]|nr:hypothetical protein [Candidatus Enteromonas sp.]
MKRANPLMKLWLVGASFLLTACIPAYSSASSENPSSSLEEPSSLSSEGVSSSEAETPSSKPSSEKEQSSLETERPSSEDSVSSSLPETSIPTEESSSVDETTHAFEIKNSEHIAITVLSDDGKEAIEGNEGNSYYVRLQYVDEALYGVNTLTVSYFQEGNSKATTVNILNKKGSGVFKNDYFFKVYTTSEPKSPYTIEVTEKSMIAYEESPFVGTYLFKSLFSYAAHDYTSFDSNRYVTINPAGEISCSWTSTVDAQIDQVFDAYVTSQEGYSTKSWYYGEHILFGTTDANRTPFGSGCNDYFVGIQKLNSSDPDSLYALNAETFTVDGVRYFSLTATRDGAPYASAFAADADKEANSYFLPNVDFHMLQGTQVTDANLLYEVKNGDTLVKVVGTTGEGGCANRALVQGLYGNFEVNGKTLFLNGVDKAVYDGDDYAYAIDNGSITLTSGLHKVIFSVQEDGSIAFVEERDEEGYDFHGHTYFGTWTYDGDASSFYVVFDATESTFQSGGGNGIPNALNWSMFLFGNGHEDAYSRGETEYVYDEATFTLSARIIDCQHKTPETAIAFSMVFDPIANSWQITSGNTPSLAYHGVTLAFHS